MGIKICWIIKKFLGWYIKKYVEDISYHEWHFKIVIPILLNKFDTILKVFRYGYQAILVELYLWKYVSSLTVLDGSVILSVCDSVRSL